MYTMVPEAPSRSFCLFGPRATGKSTWLGQHFAAARSFDLFETYVLHELRAHNDYARLGCALSYSRTASGVEVDFVWSRGKQNVAIEVKSSPVWKREYDAGLAALAEAAPLTACHGVYGGKDRLVDGKLKVLPVTEFLDRLYAGKILG